MLHYYYFAHSILLLVLSLAHQKIVLSNVGSIQLHGLGVKKILKST